MKLVDAQRLVYGAKVRCPADRGDAAYVGTVRHVDPNVQTNIRGVTFLWVTVLKLDGQSAHVWPSNRLA